MPDLDPVAARLREVQAPDAVRADVWDAFHQSATADEFATKVKTLAIPDAVKADLWDLKQAAAPDRFVGTNEKDAAGNAVIRGDEPSATNLAIWGEIGPPPGVSDTAPYGLIYDAAKRWVAAGPHAVVEGVKDIGAGNYAKGANQIVRGGAITAAPFYAPALARALVAAPMATATSVVGGTGAAMVSAPVAEAVSAAADFTPDQADLLKTAAELGSGYLGSKVTPSQAVAAYEAVRHPWMTVGRGVGTAAEAATATYQARQAARAARQAASAAGDIVPAADAATVGPIMAEAPVRPTAPPPSPPPVTSRSATAPDAATARVIAEARATATPPETPAASAPAAAAPRPSAPSLRAAGRWGPGESVGALRQAAEQAGYPISEGELKNAWPSVQAAGADGGPAVAALHIERMQARTALVADAASMTPEALQAALEGTGLSEMAAARVARQAQAAPTQTATTPAPAVTPPVEPSAPVQPVITAAAPPPAAVTAPEGRPIVAAAPPRATPAPAAAVARPVMSHQMALNEIGMAARRAQMPMTLEEATAAAQFVQEGSTPARALQQWTDAGRPSAAIVTTPRPAAPPSGPPGSIMSPQMALNEIGLAARRANVPMTLEEAQAAAEGILRDGLTPKAAVQRWLDAAVERSAAASGAAPAAPVKTREELAADLAQRLGTPSPVESDAAIDARWRRGELKTPSAPTAARMRADAGVAVEEPPAPAPAPVPPLEEPPGAAAAPPSTAPVKPRLVKPAKATVEPATPATATDTPAEAAQTVTTQIEHVIDTQGLKSGAAVQARVMKSLTESINGAREAAGFGDITTRRSGTTGGTVMLDGEPVAVWEKNGHVKWLGGGTGMHGRSLGPAPDVIPGVPADTPIGTYPINARNMTPGEVERAAKNAVAASVSRARGAGQMVVRIPGDGNFTIERNPHAINELMKRLQSAGVSIWKDLL